VEPFKLTGPGINPEAAACESRRQEVTFEAAMNIGANVEARIVVTNISSFRSEKTNRRNQRATRTLCPDTHTLSLLDALNQAKAVLWFGWTHLKKQEARKQLSGRRSSTENNFGDWSVADWQAWPARPSLYPKIHQTKIRKYDRVGQYTG
jgi:hypothetical protein